MLIKVLIFILLLFMLFNLFKAMQSMAKPHTSEKKMTHFIGRRVLFSSLILALLFIAIAAGVITPNPRPY